MPEIALPELIFYALMFFVLALAFTARKITQALLGGIIAFLQAVPVIGSGLAAPFKAVEQAVVNACGAIENGCDSLMGAAWHATARLLDWTWRELRSHAGAIAAITPIVGSLVAAYHALRALVHSAVSGVSGVLPRVKSLEREYHGIERDVRTLEREVGKGIGADVLPRIRSLEREVGTIESQVIPRVESAEQALQNDITQLGEYVRANFVSTATDAVAAAVAVALSALGLGGLRCASFGRFLNKYACGLGGLLDSLLQLMIAAIVLESVCDFLPLIEDAFGAVAGPMVHLLNEVPLGACENMPASWSLLSVTAGPLPPAQTLGTLPS